jgi:hypothetical protein
LIGVDAGEQCRLDAEIAQDAVERRIPEAADAVLVDLDVLRLLLEPVDDGGRQESLVSTRAPLPGSGSPIPKPLPEALKMCSWLGGMFMRSG